MKIAHDDPGRRLTLVGEAPRIWPAAYALALWAVCLPFVVYTVWLLPDAFAAEAHVGQGVSALVLCLFWAALLTSSARGARAAARWVTGVDVDRVAGELRLRQSGLTGGLSPEAIVPLKQLAEATVRRTARAPSLHDPLRPVPKGSGVALRFGIQRAGTIEARELQLRIDHLERPAEVVDLALRLGAAAGLGFYRVVRSDARDVEVALRQTPQDGFAPIPSHLDPADYARDAVAPAARAAVDTETIPAFDPAAFKSDHRLVTWKPGSEIAFSKPLSLAALLALPFLLLALTGPAVFFFSPGTADNDLGTRVLASAFLGFFGLLFAAMAAILVVGALPRAALVDWSTRTIRIGTYTKRKAIAFDAVRAVEMKAQHRVSGAKSPSHSYSCEVGVRAKDPAGSGVTYEPLVSSDAFTDDPDTPYRMMLPLATELAASLGVPRRVADYD